MEGKIKAVCSLSTSIHLDLSLVAKELDIEIEDVISSLVEHLVKEMGTDLIIEGVRIDWDFAGEDRDDGEDILWVEVDPDTGE